MSNQYEEKSVLWKIHRSTCPTYFKPVVSVASKGLVKIFRFPAAGNRVCFVGGPELVVESFLFEHGGAATRSRVFAEQKFDHQVDHPSSALSERQEDQNLWPDQTYVFKIMF